MMKVQIGDLLEVLDQHNSGWTYAKNLSSSSQAGWVPSWMVPSQSSSAQSQPAAAPARPQEAEAVAQVKAASPAPAPTPAPVATPKAVVATPAPAAQSATVVAIAEPAQAEASAEARNILPARCAFTAAAASQLSLAPSELVEVVERHGSGWTYGRKVSGLHSEGPCEGWFPDWVVPKPAGQK
jgi:hypothetical protein